MLGTVRGEEGGEAGPQAELGRLMALAESAGLLAAMLHSEAASALEGEAPARAHEVVEARRRAEAACASFVEACEALGLIGQPELAAVPPGSRSCSEARHRVRNSFVMAQSIARQTARSATGIPAFLEAFERRMGALAAAHDLLAVRNWRAAVGLPSLARSALRPYLGDGRVRLGLAEAALAPALVQGLALTLHELASNATRHGALSLPTGRVELVGGIEGEALALRWEEEGGPLAEPPAKDGFGLALIRRTITRQLKGDLDLRWRREGLACTMRLPLAVGALAPA